MNETLGIEYECNAKLCDKRSYHEDYIACKTLYKNFITKNHYCSSCIYKGVKKDEEKIPEESEIIKALKEAGLIPQTEEEEKREEEPLQEEKIKEVNHEDEVDVMGESTPL